MLISRIIIISIKCFLERKANSTSLTLYLPDQICSSPYLQPYNSYNVGSENLIVDQLIILERILFFILITYLVDIARKNYVLVTHESLRVKVLLIHNITAFWHWQRKIT